MELAQILRHAVNASVHRTTAEYSRSIDEFSWHVNVGSSSNRYSSGRFQLGTAEGDRPSRLQPQLRDYEAHSNVEFWVYKMKIYITHDRELTPDDVLALVNEEANRRRLRLEKAHALQSMTREFDKRMTRTSIPQEVKVVVWQRDGGQCVDCGSQSNLEFDHVIPLAMGGSNTMRNLQLLCATCNRRKGATLG